MKTRRLVATFVLLTSLITCSISTNADEKLTSLQTALSNTTIGGSVNSTVDYQTQPSQPKHGGWWQVFLHWVRFQAQ
jgi:hypothetical protein